MKKNKIAALVGRVNVGKSSLFNALLRRKKSITHDRPGVTRDCKFEYWKNSENSSISIVDTPGYFSKPKDLEDIDRLEEQDIGKQITSIVTECDLIVYIIDAAVGILAEDNRLIKQCYKTGKPIIMVANKIDIDKQDYKTDIYKVNANAHILTDALHKQGTNKLSEAILNELAEEEMEYNNCYKHSQESIAIVGKPNVGKSTLINTLLGKQAAVTSPTAGTTRDSITHEIEWQEKKLTIIDTAGIRRRTKINDTVEKESVIQVMQAIRATSKTVLYLIDANAMLSDQDRRLINIIQKHRKKILIVANKIDTVNRKLQKEWHEEIQYQLRYNQNIDYQCISAVKSINIDKMMTKIISLTEDASKHSTSFITKLLEKAVEKHEPPMINNRRIKLKFAHISDKDEYTIVIMGNQVTSLPLSYSRYLAKYFQEQLKVKGINIIIELKDSNNPYTSNSK